MASRALFALSLLVLLSQAYGQEPEILFPEGDFNFTGVDTGLKNSGLVLSDEVEEGFIHIGSTADTKGAHLGSAALALSALNDTESKSAAQTLLSLSTESAQSLLNADADGQSLATTSLYPFLSFQNGTVMSQLSRSKPFLVHVIYYGKFWSKWQKHVVENFIKSINPTVKPKSKNERAVYNWWQITSKYYYDSKGRRITSDVRLKSTYHDKGSAYPMGTVLNPLTDKDIRNIVVNANSKKFGKPVSRAAYLVLTDKSTYVNDFCQSSCAYHSSFRTKKTTIAYAQIGDPSSQCPQKCSYMYFDRSYNAANGLGVDAAVNWVAHELAEIATNPFQQRQKVPGWVVRGSTIELGDFCEWDYGFIGFTKSYATYNLKGNADMRFLIQRNWNRKLKRCTIVANDKADAPMSAQPS